MPFMYKLGAYFVPIFRNFQAPFTFDTKTTAVLFVKRLAHMFDWCPSYLTTYFASYGSGRSFVFDGRIRVNLLSVKFLAILRRTRLLFIACAA